MRPCQIDVFNSTNAVEADISDRREVEKIDIALDGRFQFCLGVLKWRHGGRVIARAVFADSPVRAIG